MLGYAVAGPVDAVFNGVADAGEALEAGRMKSEGIAFVGGFDEEAVRQVDYDPGMP